MSLTLLTPKKRELFLSVLSQGESVTAACKAVGITKPTLYSYRKQDAVFAKEWEDAIESGTDTLEDEAKRRAVDGSDTLLIFLLKGRRPAKFKDNAITYNVDYAKLTDEQISRLAAGEHPSTVLANSSPSGDGETPSPEPIN